MEYLKSNKNRKIVEILAHVCICVLIFTVPVLIFLSSGRNLNAFDIFRFIALPLEIIIVFYLNYLLLIKKLLLRKKIIAFISINVALICALLSVQYGISTYMEGVLDAPIRSNRRQHFLLMFMLRNSSMMFLVAGLSVAIKITANWYKQQLEIKESEKEKSALALKNLKNQLNPHFLFNTLNNIYALIGIDSTKAQEAVHDLSGLLRYAIKDGDCDTVSLNKEIEFINNYITLMRLRINNDTLLLNFNCDVNDNCDVKISPLLFINVIENAFKHGINYKDKSFIDINISLNANILNFSCKNSIIDTKSDKGELKLKENSSGIGLSNLKKRLNYLYPQKHCIYIFTKDNCYFVEIKIEL